MRIAKPLLLVSTPLGVAFGLVEGYRLAGGLVVLMAALLGMLSVAAATVVDTVAEWLRLPEVPVSVTVALPAAAVAAAVRVTVWAVPGVKVSVAGLAVTPLGSPVMATAMVLLKELIAVARTLTFEPFPPATRDTDAGETEREKSPAGATAVTVAATVVE